MSSVTLPTITGTLTVEPTDAGHIIRVAITPGPTERTWTASLKYWSMPPADILDNAARRLLVAAVQQWLTEPGEVHPALEVEGVEDACPPTNSPNSSPPSTASTNCIAGSST